VGHLHRCLISSANTSATRCQAKIEDSRRETFILDVCALIHALSNIRLVTDMKTSISMD
jgi:hypothetical protein